MRKTMIFLLCISGGTALFSQPLSPEQFLGYKLGSCYTPHHRIVDYFRQVAEKDPEMVQLEQYGLTNEGRPLLLAFISTPENMGRLEDIRENNLRLAGFLRDKSSPSEKTPAIVWLSYNVHGNEASSSEAAMKTIWALVDPANTQTREWLKQVVVIIDPCENPDGRDRYVNWFNSVAGRVADPDTYSREHHEPWPGGRTNHYNFDLNRDWAWQTQVESQQRIKEFNRWLPQVHVDFHEQGYNAPYYFAPAAQPFHEVITPWQREFQNLIGRNNAKYFDEKGWLFFTKEEFDLFYPSYGDTYPTYRGAIGMTYEQGGGGRGGKAVVTLVGDTLTLMERLIHHYTTSLSTIETAATQVKRLIREFHKYYELAVSAPGGEFKAYIVKADEGGKLEQLKTLLDRNAIKWSYTVPAGYSGLNYLSSKNESFRTNGADIVINANQPNSNLIRVLFERNSRINDSVTYDITAWSLPYVYGLKTYGMNSYISSVSSNAPPAVSLPAVSGNPLAFAIPWKGLNSARCLTLLLDKGIKVRYSELPFSENGMRFDAGTLLAMRTSNERFGSQLADLVKQVCDSTATRYYPIQSGLVDNGHDFGSNKIHFIPRLRISLLSGDGVSALNMGEVWFLFDRQLKYPVHLVNVADLDESVLSKTDVLIIPNGRYRLFSNKEQNARLKAWVKKGGRIVAMENAVAQMAEADWGIKKKKDGKETDGEEKTNQKSTADKDIDSYRWLRSYADRRREPLTESNPGAIFRVDLDNSNPLAFGYGSEYYTLKLDNNIYQFLQEDGWNVGIMKKNPKVEGFVGAALNNRIRDCLVFGVQELGRGQIVYLSDDPLFRSFWENGKLLFCNAVFMVGEQ